MSFFTSFFLNNELHITATSIKKFIFSTKNYPFYLIVNHKKIYISNNFLKSQKYSLSVKFNDFRSNLPEFTQSLRWVSSLVNCIQPPIYSVLSHPVLLPTNYNLLTTQKSPHVNGRAKSKYIKGSSDWILVFYLFTSLTWWALKLYINYFFKNTSFNTLLSPASFTIKKIPI